MRCSHDLCISIEIIYKDVEVISSAPNPGQNSYVICFNDPLIFSEILIKC